MTDEILSLDDAARLLFVAWADRLDEGLALLEYDRLSLADKAEWQRRARNHHNDVAMFFTENTGLRARIAELEASQKRIAETLGRRLASLRDMRDRNDLTEYGKGGLASLEDFELNSGLGPVQTPIEGGE